MNEEEIEIEKEWISGEMLKYKRIDEMVEELGFKPTREQLLALYTGKTKPYFYHLQEQKVVQPPWTSNTGDSDQDYTVSQHAVTRIPDNDLQPKKEVINILINAGYKQKIKKTYLWMKEKGTTKYFIDLLKLESYAYDNNSPMAYDAPELASIKSILNSKQEKLKEE